MITPGNFFREFLPMVLTWNKILCLPHIHACGVPWWMSYFPYFPLVPSLFFWASIYHTWAPSDQWVCTDQSQRSGMGVQTNWNFRQTNWNFMVVYTLLKKHAFAILKFQKNGPSDQSGMRQDQSWPQGAHICPIPSQKVKCCNQYELCVAFSRTL